MSGEKSSSGGFYRVFHILTGVLAAMVSWYFNKSILWAILHFVLSWMYIAYCLLTKAFSNGKWQLIVDYYFN